ncbi:AAA family ATPase [Leptotrichia trevisanii]|uniref:Endonuclease GajA/Old nuclease/RecF-like AAA domain-containing protein n=1 Tax=Leptotrichia trevisanii TaxID=109328 RepID=A0A510K5N0_9FUSO|nr:AAA family ATPase [Leptotrichia trevisanii]BBM45123.1 hypothetical protein JMUB3870_1241 [Leptotrichia trevisanii]
MFPIYMYVKEYKGLKDFEITFDNNYEIKYNRDKDTLSINKKCESANNNIENFYSINKTKGNIDSVNLLIGKNGSGKTSILEMLNMSYFEKKKRKSYFDKLEIEINYMILYKSSKDDENFIFEERYIAKKFTKRKEIEEIRIQEEIYKSQDDGNYIENTGVLKFSFKEKIMKAAMREAKFEQKNIGGLNKLTLYKLNIGLENGSKGKIYNYLVNVNKGENFENSYLTLQIPNLYEAEKIKQIKDKIIDVNSNERIDDFIRLYDINKNNLKDTILNTYFNFIYSEIIWKNLRENSKTKKELKERKKELLKLLNNESSVYRKFEILLEEYENSINNIIKINKEKYRIIEKVADLIDNIVSKIESENEMDIENKDEIIRKFKISCKKENKEVLELLKEYDDFYIPKIERDLIDFGNSLFKEVEFIKIEEEGLSDGEKVKLGYFSTLYSILNGEFKNKKYVTLLFDEVETYLHPEWSRRFLYELIEELGRYEDKKFKLIFATHSPFLIADVLAKDCIYLSKNKKGKIKAEIKEDVKTFGANIIDLFKNTMFLESTFGKFATEKIKGLVDKIEKAEKYSDIKSEVDFIIDEIGEKLISNKLKSMIKSKFENKDEEYYRKKIEEYQAKLDELEKKENNRNSKK